MSASWCLVASLQCHSCYKTDEEASHEQGRPESASGDQVLDGMPAVRCDAFPGPQLWDWRSRDCFCQGNRARLYCREEMSLTVQKMAWCWRFLKSICKIIFLDFFFGYCDRYSYWRFFGIYTFVYGLLLMNFKEYSLIHYMNFLTKSSLLYEG